jgi:hypothetical protein
MRGDEREKRGERKKRKAPPTVENQILQILQKANEIPKSKSKRDPECG